MLICPSFNHGASDRILQLEEPLGGDFRGLLTSMGGDAR
jgi:hypothetical protein